jgi:hypothetical protein
MAPAAYHDSLPVRDPQWTLSDYLRFTEHNSSRVRFWALARMEELGLDIPADCLRGLQLAPRDGKPSGPRPVGGPRLVRHRLDVGRTRHRPNGSLSRRRRGHYRTFTVRCGDT